MYSQSNFFATLCISLNKNPCYILFFMRLEVSSKRFKFYLNNLFTLIWFKRRMGKGIKRWNGCHLLHINQYLSKFLRIEFSFRMRGFDNNCGKNCIFKTCCLAKSLQIIWIWIWDQGSYSEWSIVFEIRHHSYSNNYPVLWRFVKMVAIKE